MRFLRCAWTTGDKEAGAQVSAAWAPARAKNEAKAGPPDAREDDGVLVSSEEGDPGRCCLAGRLVFAADAPLAEVWLRRWAAIMQVLPEKVMACSSRDEPLAEDRLK
jgi:hypothetical protein